MNFINRKWGLAAAFAALCLSAAVTVRYWPHAPLAARIPSSIAILDSHSELLRLTLASDQQYRLWTPLEEISPQLVDALLLHEDHFFYRHLGVNPIALVRAATATYSGEARQGGSTLTMQLARLLYGLNTRTVRGKCLQIILALGLELRYSKHDLLEAHLNLMPFGGNLQGVGTASLVYFGKNANRLVLGEALSLVVIPQSPAHREPNGVEPENLRAARMRLFSRWLGAHPEAGRDVSLMALPLRYASLDRLPFVAPHFTALMLERQASQDSSQRSMRQSTQRSIITTLSLPLQTLSERVVNGYIREQSRLGIRNAAVLLIDYRDMSARAMVGSADFFSREIDGQVNGTVAKRSPGSALKPFIYALAIDQGLIHPMTILKDAPTNFGGFSPENFDGRFVGPLTATDALIHSRNVPAVALAARLSQPSLYQFLKTAGVSKMAAENHYGLALALGGSEVTMEEIATLYAVLANRGVLAPLRYRSNEPAGDRTRLLSEEASYMTLDMLAAAPRPDAVQWTSNARLPIAWKTGTSWGFRDAWTVGVVGPYVLVVWVGNFDGRSNPALVGAQAAAPLFFRLVDAILARDPNVSVPIAQLPARLVHVDVCSASGELPNADCPQTTGTWYIPGVSPIRVSQIHRRVWIDTRTGTQACPPYEPSHTRSEIYEFWPSDLQHLFVQAGMPRRTPPPTVACSRDAIVGAPPRIISPASNVTYTLRMPSTSRSSVPLTANVDGDIHRLYWFIDEAYIGTTSPNEAIAWQAEHSGRFMVRAVDDRGRADTREFNVDIVP